MERLTQRTKDGIVGNNNGVENFPLYSLYDETHLDHGLIEQCFNKLAEYEDAEEQGLLLRLPCKVGDTVYHIEDGYIYEFKAKSIDIRKEADEYIYCIDYMDYRKEHFGKIAFLTLEEAEQALARMEGENG